MDHAYVDDNQVAERYLMGRLPPEEAARFEEHSMSCAECLDRLEAAEKLRLGLRTVAAHEVAREVAREVGAEAVKAGLLARLMRSRLAPAALTGLLGLLVVALLPAGYLWQQNGRLEGELARTREELSRSAHDPEPSEPSEIAALRRQLDEQRRAAEAGLQERDRLAAQVEQLEQEERVGGPSINIPVVPLSPERSAPGSAPSTRISLASSPDLVVLQLELDAADFPGYRATLTGPGVSERAGGWQLAGLRPDSQGSLTLALPAGRLRAGDVTIRVEGLPSQGKSQGKPAPIADFSFRVVR